MTETHEVAIAGAGPAGVACAVALVQRDPRLRGRVVLLDRARFPRSKPCGGGLTGHALDALSALGLRLTVPRITSPVARVVAGDRHQVVHLPRPVAIVRRRELDASLVEQARAFGVEVREGVALGGFRVNRDRVDLETTTGTLRARVLVGADGVASRVRRWLLRGRDLPIRFLSAEAAAPPAWGEAMAYDFTPMREGLRGYLWVFPVPGQRLNVGIMHGPTAPRPDLAGLLRRRTGDLGVRIDGELRGWLAWRYRVRARLGAPRVLLVGDAAGIDALTGEGIAVGMEQAMVAADAIIDGIRRDDFAFARYSRAVRKAVVGRELALDGFLARLLYGRRWARWTGMVLSEPTMLERYASRIAGTTVLADHKWELVRALARHLLVPAHNKACHSYFI